MASKSTSTSSTKNGFFLVDDDNPAKKWISVGQSFKQHYVHDFFFIFESSKPCRCISVHKEFLQLRLPHLFANYKEDSFSISTSCSESQFKGFKIFLEVSFYKDYIKNMG
jgi:hypothetical protein